MATRVSQVPAERRSDYEAELPLSREHAHGPVLLVVRHQVGHKAFQKRHDGICKAGGDAQSHCRPVGFDQAHEDGALLGHIICLAEFNRNLPQTSRKGRAIAAEGAEG